MNDDRIGNKALNKRINALMGGHSRRRRGRPPLGFAKALAYIEQYSELRRSGLSPWRAVKEVAWRNDKTPEHIAACRKMIEETDPFEYDIDPYDYLCDLRDDEMIKAMENDQTLRPVEDGSR